MKHLTSIYYKNKALFLAFVRRSFTFHFNGKHKLNLSEVSKSPESCHSLKCECGEEFNYVPFSDYGKDNVGAILDKYGSVWQYFKH